jgi:excinuclease ABC subunit C
MLFDPDKLKTFPQKPGVYLMQNAARKIVYIGKAKQLRSRLQHYFSKGGDERPMLPHLLRELAHIDIIIVPTEKEALLLENTLIKKHQPKYNALLKDDKTFISLVITTQHEWPTIKLVRTKGKAAGLSFGPYTSAYAARQTFELMTRLFPLRQCSDEELKRRRRPCLLYAMKRCIAPCVGLCSREEYDTFVDGAVQFLKGKDREIIRRLHKEMEDAADALEFEKAAALLHTIRHIEHVTRSHPLVTQAGRRDCDAVGLYRRQDAVTIALLLFREGKLVGSSHFSFARIAEEDADLLQSFLLQHYQGSQELPEEILLPQHVDLVADLLPAVLTVPSRGRKKALLDLAQENAQALFEQHRNKQELQEKILLDLSDILHLNRYPRRIECFDISHCSGADPVACMVAFTDGVYDRRRKRLFAIKGTPSGDDYSAMRQALTRHLLRAKEKDDLPDLIIVDGGRGHLLSAMEVFQALDIASVDVIGLAKEGARHDKGLCREAIYLPRCADPLLLPAETPLLFFLQRVRDEAHRAALAFHSKRRGKRSLASSLDQVPGIGPVKRTRLLKEFGSLERIKGASEEELRARAGLSARDVAALRAAWEAL